MDDDGDVYYDNAEDAGAYYTAKLTLSTIFPSKFGVCIIQVCVLYSNFYGILILMNIILTEFTNSHQCRFSINGL